MLVEIQMFIFYVLIYSYFFYHDCIFINFYSNAVPKFPVYGTIKFYCIVLYTLVARGRERVIENSKSISIFHRKARKTTFQRRDKYFVCMYCIYNDLKFTFAYMFSEISDL